MTTGAETAAEPVQPPDPPLDARRVADVVDIDLTSGRSFAERMPHDAFDALRAAGGVAWHDEGPLDPVLAESDFMKLVDSPGFWAVTSWELVNEVLRSPQRFSARLGTTFMPSLAPESLATFRLMMLNMDPPEHSRLRRILQPVFTPRAVEQLRQSVRRNAYEIVEELADDGPCELVRSVSAELPLRVLADLLGVPRRDRHLLFEWSNALVGFESAEAGRRATSVTGAVGELMAYGQGIAESRRREPQDDLVSRIVHAEVDGDRLDEAEFSMFWLLLVVAGNETTRNAVSGSVVSLVELGRWSWLATHRDRLGVAVEELLRYVSPVSHFRRTATTDTVLGDQRVRAGDKVVVWHGAANRDPAVFAVPHDLELCRDPNPHLAFGVGPHFCLGAHLARLEMTAMLDELLRRSPRLELEGTPTRVPSNFINGISALPVVIRR